MRFAITHMPRVRRQLAFLVMGLCAPSAAAGMACSGRAVSLQTVSCGPGTELSGDQTCVPIADAGTPGRADSGAPADASADSAADAGGGSEDARASEGGPLDGGPLTCPSGRGPTMALVPAAGTQTHAFCIDTTEVTVGQYAEFLQVAGPSDVPALCPDEGTFAPATAGACAGYTFDPAGRSAYPVTCIDWCDAYAFCEWSGKHLCGDPSGQPIDPYQYSPLAYEYACQGEPPSVPPNAYKCNVGGDDAGLKPVGICAGTTSPYSGIFDLLGNADELIDTSPPCVPDAGPCFAYGGSYEGPAGISCIDPNQQVNGPRPDVGFRCCFSH